MAIFNSYVKLPEGTLVLRVTETTKQIQAVVLPDLPIEFPSTSMAIRSAWFHEKHMFLSIENEQWLWTTICLQK